MPKSFPLATNSGGAVSIRSGLCVRPTDGTSKAGTLAAYDG